MKTKVFSIIGTLLILAIAFGFVSKSSESSVYEHVQIIAYGDFINISNNADFKKIDIKSLKKDSYDFTPFVSMINEYQSSGWEVISSSASFPNNSNNMVNCVLLRRIKK